jgi:hypothetical protein
LLIADVHFPFPSQAAALERVLPMHIWALHTVDVSQLAHFPAPSQVPLNPQLDLALGVHRAFGSVPPTATGEHVPSCPITAQLLQVPFMSVLQALSQQYPSEQIPLTHRELSEPQRAPFGANPQVPFDKHVLPGAQSALEVHLFLHSPVAASHAYTPHEILVDAGHASPLPPQYAAWRSLLDPATVSQAGALHCWFVPKLSQAPPVHLPVVPQVEAAKVGHLACGSREPSGTAVHRPWPFRLQA